MTRIELQNLFENSHIEHLECGWKCARNAMRKFMDVSCHHGHLWVLIFACSTAVFTWESYINTSSWSAVVK